MVEGKNTMHAKAKSTKLIIIRNEPDRNNS
jgi:hypothetical protein